MKKLALIFSFLLSFMSVNAQIQGGDLVVGSYLVRLVDGASPEDVIKTLNIRQPIEKNATIAPPPQRPDVTKPLTSAFPLWQIDFFDLGKLKPEEVFAQLKNSDGVSYVAYNRYLDAESRVMPPIEPNDPSYSSQWQYDDPQDNDIDGPEAWELTTGGTTNDGHAIVVAVLEFGGSDWDHIDLIGNMWYNQDEIPNNGIDDDNNGYVDDYTGWNTGSDDDNIAAGNHGTGVTGMIGAKGNNGIGVSGINWDIEVMQIDMQSGVTSAKVIEAYEYPRVMRELWNNSNGTEGAFVVATNASWGIDGGNPANFQPWCEFYDVLGETGILNCGATTNSPFNVDVVGDMPTTCPSPYMIGVTATNNNDAITFSGYGETHIDLGAPGKNVYTTLNPNFYGYISGTSFASPLTAGVIGLIYSTPCLDFGSLALDDPQGTADLVLQYLYDGVDQVSNLNGYTATGGRLNAFNSLSLTCDTDYVTGCMDPTACNYNPDATVNSTCLFNDDCGVCDGDNSTCSPGCTDPTACNYDPITSVTDNSQCFYPPASQSCDDFDIIEDLLELGPGQTELVEVNMNGWVDTLDYLFNFSSSSTALWASDFSIEIVSPNNECFVIVGSYSTYNPSCQSVYVWPSTLNSNSSATRSGSIALPNPISGSGTWSITYRNTWNYAGTWDIDLSLLNARFQPNGEGCMDSTACNYDETATTDNGTCQYAQQYYDCNGDCLNDTDGDGVCDELEIAGCTDYSACNFNINATNDDGSCTFPEQYYDCNGDCLEDQDGDGVCDEFELSGCTDPSACNYDETATDESGECSYPQEYRDCAGNCLNDADEDGVCDELEVAGCTDPTACNYDTYTETDNSQCTYPDQYYDCDGNCLNDSDGDDICDELEIVGCTDASACNYDETATESDDSCIFADPGYDCDGNCLADTDGDGVCDENEIPGCTTDPDACNYNANATNEITCTYPEEFYDCDGNCLNDSDEDGVCDELESGGCIDPGACNYDSTANFDDGSCTYAPANRDCNGDCVVDTDGDGICDTEEGTGSGPCAGLTTTNYYKTYPVVEIGNQCWFKENLETSRYANGETIPEINNASSWASTESGARAIYLAGETSCEGLINEWAYDAVGDSCCVIDTLFLEGDFVWTELELAIVYGLDSLSLYSANTYTIEGKLNSGESLAGSSTSTFWTDRVKTRGLWDSNKYFPAKNTTDPEGYYPGGICKQYTFNVSDQSLDHYIHIAADNYAIVILNGDTILHQSEESPVEPGKPDPYNYKSSHVYPIEVVDGSNSVQLEIINQSLYGMAYFEVYQNTASEILNATQESDLNILFSTYNSLGEAEFANDCVTGADRCQEGFTYLPELEACSYRSCVYYPNYYREEYGFMYNWYTVEDSRSLCPVGWRVPSDDDWKELESFLGVSELDLDKIGLRAQSAEISQTLQNTNGFNATFGGIRYDIGGNFERETTEGFWWTSTSYKTRQKSQKNNAWFRAISDNGIGRGWNFQQTSNGIGHGMYVRCIKD